MKTYKLALGIALTITLGIVVYHIKKVRVEKRLITISDAGYETAYDILYPIKVNRFKRR